MLHIVATPIGHLGDITLRALDALRAADLIAAEDTRHTQILLRHHQIDKPLVSYHEHNEARRTAELLGKLRAGANLALVTDAGHPSISDPGLRLVRACAEAGLPYTILPGPSAVTTAIAGAAFPGDGFRFAGFLPHKSGGRRQALADALAQTETTVFFEAPTRLLRTLQVLAELAPDRLLCVCRELTKKFEEYRRAPASELLLHFQKTPPRGEITLVVSGQSKTERRAARDQEKAARRHQGPAKEPQAETEEEEENHQAEEEPANTEEEPNDKATPMGEMDEIGETREIP